MKIRRMVIPYMCSDDVLITEDGLSKAISLIQNNLEVQIPVSQVPGPIQPNKYSITLYRNKIFIKFY
jgi:hypothetical protein